MAAADDNNGRITVSRDALRADLAELELRMQAFIALQLTHKADEADLARLAHDLSVVKARQAANDRGEWSDANVRLVRATCSDLLDQRTDRAWTRRDQAFAVLSATTAVAMLILSVVLALHGVII